MSLARPPKLNNGGTCLKGPDFFAFNRYYMISNKMKNPVNQ
ncbi:hypothetical protein SAMN02745246_02050 [Leeuwenhoekiella marinoflava DSM 3653]|uniref:Uncharacterized protein n=2 Tax=Leeuwenhoekiella marinoflava TaxID=988 RepID=A0A4Q0PLM5_9FLAO|nr:hypothetical protein DSL99_1987 [Leeuwenhoekiella marinoflava]SHF25931.1 hypothetical protein SAMN02745246_02050 [Leeuwenhoekiella marinoflava DSM 3653]